MSENKTRPEARGVDDFIAAVADATRREDARALVALMQRLSGEPPVMWGPSIIGFGAYHYRYDSGREGSAPRLGFSPRAKELVLYLLDGSPHQADLLARLGKHRTGKSCLYIKRMADVDVNVLEELVADSLAQMDTRYPRA